MAFESSLLQRISFSIHDKVEVRSEGEEGLQGSWHSGVIIQTPLLDNCQIKYVIQFDHMLAHDESDYCIEPLTLHRYIEACQSIRGRIRPIPPPLRILNIWNIYYGMCVDVFYNDCWWEGVVFDYEDGSATRAVFFPDLGDEMKIHIAHIRITQDWNDVTGIWNTRGTWFFLELLEELEDGIQFPFSPKQFWFELIEKKKFIQKLGDWTSSDKHLWKFFVLETLRGKVKTAIGHSDVSGIHQEFVESVNFNNVNVQQCQSDGFVRQQGASRLSQDLSRKKNDEKSDIYSASGGNDMSGKCKNRYNWLPAGPDMVPGPEFFPDAAIKYLQLQRGNKKYQYSVLVDVRKHLLHLNWNIDYSRDDRPRLRYTSPDGVVYYSLRQVCLSLTQDENGSPSRKTNGSVRLRSKGVNTLNQSAVQTSKRVKQVNKLSHHKPLTLLSWLIKNNIVFPRAKVHFYRRNESISTAGGRITREGIMCICCYKLYTLGGFTFHVSGGYHRPASSICLNDGNSLLDCLKKIVHKQMANFEEELPGNLKSSLHQGENDSICSVCLFGGELLLCDHCPSSFHKTCLGLLDVAEGDWFCPSCCCKICGHKNLDGDTECSFEDDTVLNCTQCQRKYHIRCIRNRGNTCLKRIPSGNWFCTNKCKEIYLGLNEILGKPISVGLENLTWTLLKPNYLESHKLDAFSDEASIENCSKLSIAVDIMHECFEPFEDPHTKRDLLKDVIFNKRSELNRLNFEGFYTVILQKDDEFISAATIRIYGEKVAEMPLMGTRFQYRRLGMCRILMNELEQKLVELGVEGLILPAIPCVLNTWTGSFGFSKLTVSERSELVDYTFLDFQGATMCHKQLMKTPCAESREILPRLNNMDLDGSITASQVFQVDQILAGTSEQDVTLPNSNNHTEGPIDSVITLNSESEPCNGKTTKDCSVEKKETGKNNSDQQKEESRGQRRELARRKRNRTFGFRNLVGNQVLGLRFLIIDRNTRRFTIELPSPVCQNTRRVVSNDLLETWIGLQTTDYVSNIDGEDEIVRNCQKSGWREA
ncbi:Acyl-CoA N-acyltransferase with RING/FYVE/PHD-type zinc finger protein [Euphorbia peplus]|nr:Acyl-CoA N-acyltransferase with RING/FYVE/PHD-type zinc finger protein [Euphorbia peplus]